MKGKSTALMLMLAVLSVGCGAPAPAAALASPSVPAPMASLMPSPTVEPRLTATSSPPLDLSEPPVKAQLHASEPASVQLANGQPTLVEFFAFW